MGLLLSVLVSCVGVVEAIACVKRITYGALPTEQSDLHKVTQKYDELFAKAAKQNNYKIEDFDMCGRGYLEINGGGSKGPIKATIKYFGKDQDSIPILFSTKISSFGQESVESDIANKRTPSKSPDRNTTVKTQIPQEQSFYINKSSSSRENLSDESPFQSMESPEPKEKIKWHYRPLSPSGGEKSLPEIHFDSYERNSFQSDQSSFSEDFLRSLDGVRFKPLQRDDGTGRRRSFKKRHSSSSTSSRESKASREEELKIFTSLEENEFENAKTQSEYNSAPNLSANYHSNSRSRTRSKEKSPSENSPSNKSSIEDNRSISNERPHLKDIPKQGSFDEATEIQKETSVEDNLETFPTESKSGNW